MIEPGRTVSIEYTLTLDDGQIASSNVGQSPLVYQHGNSQILPALEDALAGLQEGDTKTVLLEPDQGYGSIDPNAFVEVAVDVIPEGARRVGAMLVGRDPSGGEHQVRVHEVHDDRIVLDQNHPLAGEHLHFEVTVVSVE